MKTLLLVTLLIMQLGFSEPSICIEYPQPLNIASLPLKSNSAFTYKIDNYANPATIINNQNGTFFNGNFSKVTLFGAGWSYQYQSVGFSFKYPSQHQIVDVKQDIVELQMQYQLKDLANIKWKHRTLVMSVTFLVAEYAPGNGFTIGKQINPDTDNGTIIDFNSLLHLIPRLPVILYKGIHSQYPDSDTVLWLVRKELMFVSHEELEFIKRGIWEGAPPDGGGYHGLVKRLSDLNEINEKREDKKKGQEEQML